MALGDYTPITFLNGTTKLNATNMGKIDNKLKELDADNILKTKKHTSDLQLMRQFNQKEVYSAANTPFAKVATGWTTASCTVSADTTYHVVHDQSLKLAESDNSASYVYAEKSITALDFTKFNDGRASSTDDLIVIWFWISNISAIDTSNSLAIYVEMGTDGSNKYQKGWNTGLASGINVVYAKKSAFSSSGSPNWNNIAWFKLGWRSLANKSGESVSFNACILCRVDPVDTNYFSFVQNQAYSTSVWANIFEKVSSNWILTYDRGAADNIIIFPAPTVNSNISLKIDDNYKNFHFTTTQFMKNTGGDSLVLCWYVDANNYVRCYLDNSVLYLERVLNGASTVDSIAVSTLSTVNDLIYLDLIKQGSRLIAKYHFSGSLVSYRSCYLENTFDSTYEGDIYLGDVNSRNAIVYMDISAGEII